jgi:hypothetical protein
MHSAFVPVLPLGLQGSTTTISPAERKPGVISGVALAGGGAGINPSTAGGPAWVNPSAFRR